MLRHSTFIAALGLMIAGTGCDRRTRALQQQEIEITTAVLVDVLQQPEVRGVGVVCVGIADDPGSPRADPSPVIIANLRRRNVSAYPVSECDVLEAGVRHRTAGRGVLIGVGKPDLRSNDVAKATGWLFIANFDARSWIYTLNRGGEEWTVATAKLEAVS